MNIQKLCNINNSTILSTLFKFNYCPSTIISCRFSSKFFPYKQKPSGNAGYALWCNQSKASKNIVKMAQLSFTMPNGAKIPAIGLGTWEAKNEDELVSTLNICLDLGYRHIDTAFAYQNEQIIGKTLKGWFDTGKIKREDLFITTKLPVEAIREDKVEEYLTTSLKNLALDYVDLYLLHFPVCLTMDEKGAPAGSLKSNHPAVWKKMEEQVDAGRTKAIGLSNFTAAQIERLLKTNPKIIPANLQVELHVYLQQQDLVKYCHSKGITVTAYSPLGNPGYNKFIGQFGKAPRELPNMLNDKTVKSIAEKHKKTNAQVMLRYLIQRDIVVIPKSVTPSRLKENFEIFDFSLDDDDMKALNGLEVGEEARVVNWELLPMLQENEDWPWGKV